MNEEIEYLARSDTRIELLRVLAEGPKGKRDLHDRLDASRTTLSRSLDRMAEFGWVERKSNGDPYRLTALGAHVEREFSDLLEGLEIGDRLAPLLGRASLEEFDLDPRELADARVVEATPEQPLAPVERAMEARAESDSIREFATVVMQESADQIHDRIEHADDEATIEVVLDASVAAAMREDADYSEDLQQALADGAVDYYVHEDLPYLLALLDERVLLGVVDERGTPVALVESDAETVYEWGERTFEQYRTAADPLVELA
jgi:predicted transcriptional regulator